MRSLFAKIFLWFWSANVLMVSVLVLTRIGGPSGPDREKLRTMTGSMIAALGEKALATLEHSGLGAAREQIGQLRRDTGIQLFLLDAKGEEVLAQVLPAGGKERALQAPAGDKPEMNYPHGAPPIVARRVTGDSAKAYVVLGQLPPGPMAALSVSPYLLSAQLAAVVLMGGVVCYWLAHHLTQPLGQLRASVRAFANGNLGARAGGAVSNRRDEIGDLGRDVNFMAERIESLISAQRRLLTDVSHELRSPLARLSVALGLAHQRTGPEARESLDRGELELDRLNELIGRLLELGRLESSTTVAREGKIDLARLVREVIADAEFESGESSQPVRMLRCDACMALGRAELLRGAIENVLRNAIRYTKAGTQVEVTLACEVHEEGLQATIRVRDHGPGVPQEALQNIFRPFYRIGDDRNRSTGGAGLGLAIAQQAVRVHGGTIEATNTTEGGLVVEIRLPTCEGVFEAAAETPS